MKQILVIHGGDAFATYQEYIASLQGASVYLTDGQKRGWKSRLGEALGTEYNVTSPRMPNGQNAKYDEWKLWFEKYIPLLDEDVILIGHSLGGSFLARYLSENQFPKKIRATLLIAPPYDTDGDRKLVEFGVPESLDLLNQQGGEVVLYHSKDDPVVNFAEQAKYQNALPRARVRVFEDRGHFIGEEFPEIIEDLRTLD